MTAAGDARLPDAWWDSLPADRKTQIFRWIAGREGVDFDHPHIDGQTDILALLPKGLR